jgi:fumarate reductase subunit C
LTRQAQQRARPAFQRPMRGWWRRDPFFVRYMWREATAFAVAAYALLLTVGVACLSQGESAWNTWLDTLRSPVSIILHGVLLMAMIIHAKSWFEIMPKTMPPVYVLGKRLSAVTITRAGWAAAIAASALLFGIAWWAQA